MTTPTIHPTAFVHDAAHVIGNVTLGARVSIWPTAVLRGDNDAIVIGEDSNVQDGTIVHVDPGVPCTIARCPIATRRPIAHGTPGSTWTMVPSCTLLSSPMTIASLSPRSTAVGHTLTRAPRVTSPITCAAGWTNAVGWMGMRR